VNGVIHIVCRQSKKKKRDKDEMFRWNNNNSYCDGGSWVRWSFCFLVWIVAVAEAMTTTTTESGNAFVHFIEYATYNTSSSLGPWAPAVLNEQWDTDTNQEDDDDDAPLLGPVWCIQNNPITATADEKGQVGQADHCLLLRVFQPKNMTMTKADTNSNSTLLPVMIWIHGGIYLLGSGVAEDFYSGEDLVLEQDIIVVTINYRLGPHGFLGYRGTYGDTTNAGILDQQVAIDWTHRYIDQFGGDATHITLAGESAGATSVNLHMAHPETQQFFQRAILQSNPAGINFKTADDQADLFRTLATEQLNCGDKYNTEAVRPRTDEELMDCLVTLSKTKNGMSQILLASTKVMYINNLYKLDIWMSFYTWAPSIDIDIDIDATGTSNSSGCRRNSVVDVLEDDNDGNYTTTTTTGYITGQPNKVVLDTWPSDKAVLIGTNEDEGRFFIELMCTILDAIPTALFKCDAYFDWYDATMFQAMVVAAYGIDVVKLNQYYKYQTGDDVEVNPQTTFDTAPEQFANLITDSVFTCPNYDMARGVAAREEPYQNTYYYRYGVDAICTVANTLGDCQGFSCHGDEIATVFGTYDEPTVAVQANCTQEQIATLQPFVEVMQHHWGHFIREGTPAADPAASSSSSSAGASANTAGWNPFTKNSVYLFAQQQQDERNGNGSGNGGGVEPTEFEAPFTTHHTETETHTAVEVCQTWATHTYKSEESSSSGSSHRMDSSVGSSSSWMVAVVGIVYSVYNVVVCLV